MYAFIVYGIPACLGLLGVLAPVLENLLTPDACIDTGMRCAITVGHVFGY
ncbi:hypothetical protein [Pandoraea sputorum]|nr:hypothetical protein [Pandoraea sputorum]VVE58978.1 hypothetical protein PSP20601_05425 [Pandoraea sputorum]